MVPPDSTRATLILRLKDWRDQTSWQNFFDIYWQLIYGVAIRHGLNRHEAQDVVQETMIAVARHMPGFKYDPAVGSFKAWLLQLTRWRIADQMQKRQAQATAPEETEDASSSDDPMAAEANQISPDLEKIWDAEWAKNLLEAATAKARRRLDPQQYQLFDFYVNKEWSAARVAKVFRVSINQVYQAKHRVTEAIKEEAERLQKEVI